MGAPEAFTQTTDVGHYIGGRTVPGSSGRQQAVYNPATGQYEPQHQVPAVQEKPAPEPKVAKTTKTVKGLGERMLENFTRSTASGAGYTMGRTISRGILGIFGIK